LVASAPNGAFATGETPASSSFLKPAERRLGVFLRDAQYDHAQPEQATNASSHLIYTPPHALTSQTSWRARHPTPRRAHRTSGL
jgi:hypothetical protein